VNACLAIVEERFELRICIACFLALLAPVVHSQTSGRKRVGNQSDLPRFTYSLTGPASDLVQADATTFNTFAAKVKVDLDSIFRDYEIEDKATLRRLLSARLKEPGSAYVNLRARTVDLMLHEENWLSLLRPLDTFTAVTNAVRG
jgi:hypothetical protein